MKNSRKNLITHWEKSWQATTVKKELETLKDDLVLGYVLKYLPKKGKIIEAGCGLGRYVFHLSRLGYDIIGVDISAKTIKFCQNYCREIELSPKKFMAADIAKLPFSDGYFNGYLSFGVVEHFFEGPHLVLKEAYRVLKKGGRLILTTPNRYALFRPLVKVRHHFLFKGEFFQHEYSPGQLAVFLKKAGFKILAKEYLDFEGGIPEFLKFFPIGKKLKELIFSASLPVAKVLARTPLKVLGGTSFVIAQKQLAEVSLSD